MAAAIIFLIVLITSWGWLFYEFKHSQSITIEEEVAMDEALNAEKELELSNRKLEKA